MSVDDEDRAISLIVGWSGRVTVQWPEPSGERNLVRLGQGTLIAEEDDPVIEERLMDECKVIIGDAAGQVHTCDLGAEHR